MLKLLFSAVIATSVAAYTNNGSCPLVNSVNFGKQAKIPGIEGTWYKLSFDADAPFGTECAFASFGYQKQGENISLS